MDNGRLALLKAEIKDLTAAIDGIYARIGERKESYRTRPDSLDSMAYQLHNLYGAYEELFEAVARFFENNIEGARYHANLLQRMKLDIEGVRPALLSAESYDLFDELRRFRHLFRHDYVPISS